MSHSGEVGLATSCISAIVIMFLWAYIIEWWNTLGVPSLSDLLKENEENDQHDG